MKKLLLIILNLGLVWTVLLAQQSKVWNYPIGPGSPEWESSKTLMERLSLYNIPVSLLNSMNTENLVKTCLNYPELRMIFTRNSFQKGYEFLKSQFNGFVELEKRTDAGKFLLMSYSEKKHDNVVLYDDLVAQGRFMSDILYLELILSQVSIINNMDKDQLTGLKSQAIKSFEKIESLKKYFGPGPLELPALLMARVLMIEQKGNASLKGKINDEILSFVKNSGSPISSVWYQVYTIVKGD